MPHMTADADEAARFIIDRVGQDIRIAVPIGIGKPLQLVNALYRRAAADSRLRLSIFTGLTLTRPRFRSTLEARFAGPLLDRLFPTCPEALYVEAQRLGQLPSNISVSEFFLQAGAQLGQAVAQQGYISLNYSHVARHLADVGTNVFAQILAPEPSGDPSRASLGANTDVTLDMADYIERRRKSGLPLVVAGEFNAQMPYMPGMAEIATADLDLLLAPPGAPYDLFAPPKEPVSLADHAMALHAAALIRDGGTLQIGIGSFGDALTHALILRQTRNAEFRDLLQRLGTPLPDWADLAPFKTGLYGCTEMLVDGFLALIQAGIIRRAVPTPQGGEALVHAGFFVGNERFYRTLREMPLAERARIVMSPISFTNTLLGDESRKRRERQHARFINTALTVTLSGTVSSDTLEDGRVISGVGGQHDLVAQAHNLVDARSIIAVRATRSQGGRNTSNIVWSYANATVPRSLRDVVLSEYGIADIRGRSDRHCIAAMLAIADATAQPKLQQHAEAAGKIERTFALPATARDNTAARIAQALGSARRDGLLPLFPLGTEMTTVEQSLIPALGALKNASRMSLLRFLISGMRSGAPDTGQQAGLDRLQLAHPATLKDRLLQALVYGAMRAA
ncbi:MAG: acetyl-CoA hydrolase/transferase C-terminal domain-containing protein [Hyphomicrobiaceae bacterium]